MVVRYLTLSVNRRLLSFSVLTKRRAPILLTKLSENYALLGKWTEYIC